MRRIGVVGLCLLGLVGTFPRPSGAAMWDELTDARVQEALQYGRDRAAEPPERLLEPWVVRAPDGRAAVVVKSDFVSLAYLGWSAQRNGRPLTAREVDEEAFVLRALRGTLHVEGAVASSAIGLLEGLQLLDGATTREAIALEFKVEGTGANEEVRFDVYFPRGPRGELTPGSEVRIRVQGSDGREVLIPVPLARIR